MAVSATQAPCGRLRSVGNAAADRKSTRLNSSHGYISYAVFCLKKKKNEHEIVDEKCNRHQMLQIQQQSPIDTIHLRQSYYCIPHNTVNCMLDPCASDYNNNHN